MPLCHCLVQFAGLIQLTAQKCFCHCHWGLFLVMAPVRGRAFVYFLLHCLVFLFLIASCCGGVAAITSLHLDTYSSWCRVIYFSSCYITRTSAALPRLLHATFYTFLVSMSCGVFPHFHMFCSLLYINLLDAITRTSLELLVHHENFSCTWNTT